MRLQPARRLSVSDVTHDEQCFLFTKKDAEGSAHSEHVVHYDWYVILDTVLVIL